MKPYSFLFFLMIIVKLTPLSTLFFGFLVVLTRAVVGLDTRWTVNVMYDLISFKSSNGWLVFLSARFL